MVVSPPRAHRREGGNFRRRVGVKGPRGGPRQLPRDKKCRGGPPSSGALVAGNFQSSIYHQIISLMARHPPVRGAARDFLAGLIVFAVHTGVSANDPPLTSSRWMVGGLLPIPRKSSRGGERLVEEGRKLPSSFFLSHTPRGSSTTVNLVDVRVFPIRLATPRTFALINANGHFPSVFQIRRGAWRSRVLFGDGG